MKENGTYWTNYVNYYEKKVSDSRNSVGEKVPDEQLMSKYIEKLSVEPPKSFLDFGCSFCRVFPCYEKIAGSGENYYGIDIAKEPLERAKELFPKLVNCMLEEYDGRTIPFSDCYFDNVFCWGVFDACNQETILSELLRILKTGGRLVVTGKNYNYFEDDSHAFIAEVNARKNRHPNFFTDLKGMIGQLELASYKIKEKHLFLRRGDFADNIFVEELPERFYEWALIIEKTEESKRIQFKQFSNMYSQTYCIKVKNTDENLLEKAKEIHL